MTLQFSSLVNFVKRPTQKNVCVGGYDDIDKLTTSGDCLYVLLELALEEMYGFILGEFMFRTCDWKVRFTLHAW